MADRLTHSVADLRNRSIRGGAVTMISQGGTFMIRVGGLMILARWVPVAEFGLYAMVFVVASFALLLRDMGLSTATIQAPDLKESQVHRIFWVNALIGTVLTAGVAALGPVLSWFYGEPRLVALTLALSPMFLIGSLGVQHLALLRRQMRFMRLGVVTILSQSAGLAAGLLVAWWYPDARALVAMQLAVVTAMTLGLWAADPWLPRWPQTKDPIGALIRFGSDVAGFNIINFWARNLDKALIGWRWGKEPLGQYSKAYELLLLPITQLRTPLDSVAIPAMSALQNEPERYERYFLKYVGVLGTLTMPLMALGVVAGDWAVRIALGPGWEPAGQIFRVLAVAGFLQPVAGATGAVLITTGRTRRYLMFGVMNSAALCGAFAAGLPWGALGVATAYVIANYLVFVPLAAFILAPTPVALTRYLAGVGRPAAASVAAAGVTWGVRTVLPEMPVVLATAVVTVTHAVVFLGLARWWGLIDLRKIRNPLKA